MNQVIDNNNNLFIYLSHFIFVFQKNSIVLFASYCIIMNIVREKKSASDKLKLTGDIIKLFNIQLSIYLCAYSTIGSYFQCYS